LSQKGPASQQLPASAMSSRYDVMVLAQQQMHMYDLGANVGCRPAQ
jgi:hypothetical protein